MKDSGMEYAKKDSVASQSASRWLAALAMMAGTALATSAMACPPDESEGESGLRLRPRVEVRGQAKVLHDLPLLSARYGASVPVQVLHGLPLVTLQQADGDSTSTIVISSEEDGRTFEVRIENGKTTAKIDGKELPANQIRSSKGKIELLDGEGAVVHTFPQLEVANGPLVIRDGRGDSGEHPFMSGPMRTGRLRVDSSDNGGVTIAAVTPPPVMMGITMSEASGEAGIVVDKVMEGLPAGRAGIKSGDKLLQLDGEDIGGVMEFRESLSDYKAGDEIRLKVLRDGKDMDVKVKLESYNAQTLEPFVAEIRKRNEAAASPSERGSFEEAKRSIEEAMKVLNDSKISDSARAAAKDTLAKALKSLEDAKSNQQPQWWDRGGALVAPGQAGVYVPQAPRAPLTLNDTRVDDLEQKLDRLSARLENALKSLEDRQGSASAESLERARAQLKRLQQENATLQKKIEELQSKVGGN